VVAFGPIVFKGDFWSDNLDLMKKLCLLTMFLMVLSPALVYATTGSMEVDVDGTLVNVNYDTEGVEVLGIDADLDFISLIFDVNVSGSPGILEITFDRSFFDSLFAGVDDDFIIIADGIEPDSEETATSSDSRTLRIELESGTDEVEIIGSIFGEGTPEPEIKELGLAPFVDPNIDPQSYVDRYNSEESYRSWFHDNYPEYSSIFEAVGLEEPEVPEVIEEEPEVIEEEPEVMEEKTRTECGPGTVLKEGVCVLDQACGPGTVLENGICVLDGGEKKPVGNFQGLVVGAVTALIIAFIIIIILWIISRGNRQPPTSQSNN